MKDRLRALIEYRLKEAEESIKEALKIKEYFNK